MLKVILISGIFFFVLGYFGWHSINGAIILSVVVMLWMYLIGGAVSQEWPKWKNKND